MINISSADIDDYEIVEKFTLPTGHFLLEYTPDDGRGRIAHVDKMPLLGFVDCSIGNCTEDGFKRLRRWLPVTVNGVQYHEIDQHLTILFPCGGVQNKEGFLDFLDDFMLAMDYRHKYGLKKQGKQ